MKVATKRFAGLCPNAEAQAKQREWQALESVEPVPAEGEAPAAE